MPDNCAKILSIATAVPLYKLSQTDIAVKDFSRFLPAYQNAAIETRYSSVPLEWYESPSSLSERNSLYLKTALDLLEEVATKAVLQASLTMDDIDGLIIVSSSGIATPSLDALLMERMKLKRPMERLPIFGLGCAGGVIGLARTDIPAIVRKDMRDIVDAFLHCHQLSLNDIQHFLCHPGGAKVLDAIEESLELPPKSLTYSRDIMRNYGNMSAATVMFVLEAGIQNKQPGNYLLTSFGPGFTAALLWLTIS